MTKNPLINALAAALYVVCVATFMFYAPQLFGQGEDTVLIPIGILSLFVFSAAIMGYLFLSQPLILFLDGHKKEAINLFLQTLVLFGVVVIGVIASFSFLL